MVYITVHIFKTIHFCYTKGGLKAKKARQAIRDAHINQNLGELHRDADDSTEEGEREDDDLESNVETDAESDVDVIKGEEETKGEDIKEEDDEERSDEEDEESEDESVQQASRRKADPRKTATRRSTARTFPLKKNNPTKRKITLIKSKKNLQKRR